jgi:hypothetical protein
VAAEPIGGLSLEETRAALLETLLRALSPRVSSIDQLDDDQFRYRASGFLGRTVTRTLYLYKYDRSEVAKGVWVFTYEKNGSRADKVKFRTPAEAERYAALLNYVGGPEFQATATAEKEAARLAMEEPPPPPPPPPPADAPCVICGEPRGDRNPCPHCGMD